MVVTITKDKFDIAHTGRVDRLYERLWDKMLGKTEWWGEGLTVLDDPAVAASPLIVRKAYAIRKVLLEMPAEIKTEELIVGVLPMGSLGTGFVFPQYANLQEQEEAACISLSIYSVYGHSVPDYALVLNRGLAGIKADIETKLKDLQPDDLSIERKRSFLQAAIVSCDAVIAWAHRYADLAEAKAASEPDPGRWAELLAISDICRRVPEHPSRSFREALQSFWFTFGALNSTLTVAPVGRFDYYLGPFLESDLKAGAISLEEAQELVDCLWIKFNERVQIQQEHREYHRAPLKAGVGRDPEEGPQGGNFDSAFDNHWLQNLILSGLTPDGRDSTNTLTYLALELHWSLRAPRPHRLDENISPLSRGVVEEVLRGNPRWGWNASSTQ